MIFLSDRRRNSRLSPLPNSQPEQGCRHQMNKTTYATLMSSITSSTSTLSASSSQGWEHGEVERYINSDGTELLRRLFQGHLDLRYAQEEYLSRGGWCGWRSASPPAIENLTPTRNPIWGSGSDPSGIQYAKARDKCPLSSRRSVEFVNRQVF